MNKEKFEKTIENLMSGELDTSELLQHLKRPSSTDHDDLQLNDSFLLSRSIHNPDPPISDLDEDINHDFILYFINLVHSEGNHYLPIRTNTAAQHPSNVMSPNKNIINLTFNETTNIPPNLMSHVITTPSTSAEPKRIYPRSVKPQQIGNSPRTGQVFQNSFDNSHNSSVCSTPRHSNNAHNNGNRLTRNYSSLSCQSSPGFDNSPRYEKLKYIFFFLIFKK